MRESPALSPLDEENGRLSLPPAISPSPSTLHEYPPPASSQVSLHKASSGEIAVLTKNLGYPLCFLLRELEEPIPPWGDPEIRLDSSKREASFPVSPPLSPLRGVENTITSENSGKSPGRDGPINAVRLKSLLEDTGSPIRKGSSPKKTAENHEPAALSEVVGIRRGKVMRVESGVLRREALRKAGVGLRVSQVVICLVSFSVMAGNKTSGWAGDYFDRYQEYRYCFSVNVIAFSYSIFQLYAQLHHRIWNRHIISRPLSYSFDFLMDQVLTYLLMSASSSSASVNDDWISMFGSDKFTNMMIGSIVASFFAFFAFSISSIISAYKFFSLSSI